MFVDGVLAASDQSAPWEFTWNTDLLNDGPRTLMARAYDGAGNTGSSAVVSVSIQHPFTLTFRNHVFTDIGLTVQSQASPQVVPAGGALTYTYPANPGTVAYTGATSGKTVQGTQVGLLIGWNFTEPVAGLRADTVDLIVGPAYFFIYVKNSGTTSLTNFYVNYGLASQSYDNIVIPNDGVSRAIGYYKAFTNTEVRAYLGSTTSFVYWDQGTHFTLPWTDNQSTSLLSTFAGTAVALTPIEGTGAAGLLVPRAALVRDRWPVTSTSARQRAGREKE